MFGQGGIYIDAGTHFKPGDGGYPGHYPDMPVIIGVLFIFGGRSVHHKIKRRVIQLLIEAEKGIF